ncbi:hypothetical protein VTI74DRAFT_1858 [Chaetomium olivicolor]
MPRLVGLKDFVVSLERLVDTLKSIVKAELSVLLGNRRLSIYNIAFKASVAKGVADSVL